MTYKDDLEKLREEARISSEEAARARNSADSSAKAPVSGDGAGSASKPEEKKPSFFERISMSFVRNSFLAVLFFTLVSITWVAISHTIAATLNHVPRSTLVVYFIKDGIYVLLISIIMYRVFVKQFANAYHLEQDKEESLKKVRNWESIQRSMIETVPDMLVYSLDRDFRYTSFNNRHKYSMLRMWHKEIHTGECILDLIDDEEVREKTRQFLSQALKGEYFSNMEKFGDNDSTATYWQTYYAPILDEERQIIGVSCYVTNITSLKQSQSKNLFLSYHDPLTRLYNRVYCEDVFEQAEREKICPYSIIVADIRGMRQINENYGHQTGDKLLLKVSEIMSKAVKDTGSVARWGSDEFIVLLPNTDEVKAEALANICKCNFPGVTVNGIPIRVRIGYATRTAPEHTIQDTLSSAEKHSEQAQADF